MADFSPVGGAGYADPAPLDIDVIDDERPPQATAMTRKQLDEALEQRGLKSTGFNDDDQKMLQRLLDAEFEAQRAERMKKRAEMLAKRRAEEDALKLQRFAQRQLQEEADAVAADKRVTFWMHLIKTNTTPPSMVMRIDPIAIRAVVKALATNTSLQSLDLSNCELKDDAGAEIGKLLAVNRTLISLALDYNQLGPASLAAIATGLASNNTLRSLSLERNPLTGESAGSSADYSAVKQLAAVLRDNTTLVNVNLFQCGLRKEGGKALAEAMAVNRTLTTLHLSPTDEIEIGDLGVVTDSLRTNQRLADEAEAAVRAARIAARREAQARRKEEEAAAVVAAEAAWAEEQKAARQKAREEAEYAAYMKGRREQLEREVAEKERQARLARLADAAGGGGAGGPKDPKKGDKKDPKGGKK